MMSKIYINNKILISFLKKYNVKKIVLSSGSRNIPFISAVENDSSFECFSIVDERNAAFFGLGLAQESKELVAIACTSGTAVSNYISGVTEAFYSNVPLIVITFDRSPYVLNQLETQKIEQMSIFDAITKKNICLPVIKDDDDIWYCQRILNEAFIELFNNGCGPIHINVPLIGDANDMMEDSLHNYGIDDVKFIQLVDNINDVKLLKNLLNDKKILFIIGQDIFLTNKDKKIINDFLTINNIPLLHDNLSNIKTINSVNSERIIKGLNIETFKKYKPDIVITYGLNFQERIKDLFKGNARSFEHWHICDDGTIRDCFKSLTKVIKISVIDFCKYIGQISSNKDYLNIWFELNKKASLPQLPYSNFLIIKRFIDYIPKKSLLHLSILNATRLTQFFDLDESIRVYSNVNTFGIDGCLPTFLGQAFCTNDLAFIIIGDLSFFYAMNALRTRHLKNNVRVLLINNFGGGEFYISPGARLNKSINLHIGAKHNQTAKGWAESLGFEYLSISNSTEINDSMKKFVSSSDSPVFLEAFSDLNIDGQTTLDVYRYLEKSINN